MMTAVRFAVTWCFREGYFDEAAGKHVDKAVRRTLYHHTETPCIEAARLISFNPYSFDVEVTEVDTGKQIEWQAGVGRVVVRAEG